MNDHLLSVEIDSEGKQVFIHGNPDGLELLSRALSRIAGKARSGDCDHEHLFSDNWGGWELSTEPQGEVGVVADHVKIYAWPTVDGGKPYKT